METVKFYSGSFEESSIVVSRVQLFLWKFLSNYNHPEWFNEVLFDIKSNIVTPIPKYFFDEDIFNLDKTRIEYAKDQIYLAINHITRMSSIDFVEYIYEDCKNLFCEILDAEIPFSKEIYEKYYIGTLYKLIELLVSASS